MLSLCWLLSVFALLTPRVVSSPAQSPLSPPHTETWSPIQEALRYSSIIPEVLDDFEPSIAITLAYPKSHIPVELGNVLLPDEVSSRPVFEFHPVVPGRRESNKTYTLVLTDPDARSREKPKWSEFCHWIVTNLTALPSVEGAVGGIFSHAEGEVVEYYPPKPPHGTGEHRYVFVLLEGDGQVLTEPKERKRWGYKKQRHGVRDWARENNLTVVGANFFHSRNVKDFGR